MLNQAAAQAVAAAQIHSGHLKPIYDGYGFAQIPQTALHALTGAGAAGLPDAAWGDLPRRWNKVIVLLVDAFGYKQMERYADKYPFLKRFFDQGMVSPLTSQFPSTTTAHITTMYSGLPVGMHGLYEWFTYEPLLGRVIVPLLSAEADDKQIPNTLARTTTLTGEQLYALPKYSETLKSHGVAQYVFLPYTFLPSMYNEAMSTGATVIPRITFSQGLRTLTDLVQASPSPSMFFYYYGEIDTLAHRFGPESSAVDAESDTLFTALERLLFEPLQGRDDTLILFTADHGQVNTDPEKYLYLDHMLPQLVPMIRRAPDGRPISAAGSPRDVFLHIAPEYIAEARDLLAAAIQPTGAAEVFTTQELIARGYFGEVGPRFLERVGDIAILALEDHLLWFGDTRQVPKFLGMHGGLAPAEMLTHVSLLPLG